ncbi:MAG TPA: pseudouridine synthase [Chitinophagales bacterium]|nr:pseudouridine synthase [Chitinophagales bacterium]HRK26411.1 pseudouridine synthase [Chitinophagales bacterium]
MPLAVLYADDDLIAVNKPNGLLVHKTSIAADATEFALQLVRNQTGKHVYPVHRLDRATSGVLLFAFSPPVQAALNTAFENRQIQKTYLATVRGFTPQHGTINRPLNKDPQSPRLEAITLYKRLDTIELPYQMGNYPYVRYSWVSIQPLTGRMHQIRRHFNFINHPVVGDLPHGDYRHNHLFRDVFNCPFLLLHAYDISFLHPITGSSLSITAPLQEPLQNICNRFGWELPA